MSSDRISHLTVALTDDCANADHLIQAISLLSGVLNVARGRPADVNLYIAQERAKHDLRDKLLDVLK